jgi:hypothetical protein
MADPSLADQAIAALDQALRERDPLARMMMMERALKLHRQAMDAAAERPAPKSARRAKGERNRPAR